MTEQAPPVIDTPGDEQPKKGRSGPRGPRKRLLGEGEGDYCIYEVVPHGHPTIPAGSLVPIPNVPRHTDTVQATKWIRQESGDLLLGKQVMIFRAMELMSIAVKTQTAVVIDAKPRRAAVSPKEEAAG